MKRYRITAAREYEQRGEKKTAWINLGSLWLHDDGKLSGILEVAPVGDWFSGNIHCFRADEDEGQRKGRQERKGEPQEKKPAPEKDDLNDDIPI